MSNTQQRIDELVKSNEVLLFMKGRRQLFRSAVFRAARSRS